MARSSRRQAVHQVTFALLLIATTATAQLSSIPDLSTATTLNSASPTSTGDSDETTTSRATSTNDDESSTTRTSAASLTDAPSLTASFGTTGGDGASNTAFHLTGLPTIAGAGIPTLEIPYTANAPYMRKSSLPEGTFFIAVGAVLAFLGAMVLLWRAMVAWSINRSVKQTAIASMSGKMSEKSGGGYSSSYGGGWGGGAGSRKSMGYYPVASKPGTGYKDTPYANGSSVSMDNLTSCGKPLKSPHFRDSAVSRDSAASPANLFYSPTAQARDSGQTRPISGYMPSGHYASPSSHAAGGQQSTTIGGSLAPYARNQQPSPTPSSPGTTLRGVSRDGYTRDGGRSREGYSRDSNGHLMTGLSGATARNTDRNSGVYGSYAPSGTYPAGGLTVAKRREDSRNRLSQRYSNSNIYAGGQPSNSSLAVGQSVQGSTSDLGGSRAPSAYLEDLFENHGSGPRERF